MGRQLNLTCKDVQRALAALAGGKPPEPERTHVDECPDCQAFAAQCRALAERGSALRAAARPDDEAVALRLARLAQARASAPWRLPRWSLPALSASLSVSAVILVLGLKAWQPPRSAPWAPAALGARTAGELATAAARPATSTRSQGLDTLASYVLPPMTTDLESGVPRDLAVLGRRTLVSWPAKAPSESNDMRLRNGRAPTPGPQPNPASNRSGAEDNP